MKATVKLRNLRQLNAKIEYDDSMHAYKLTLDNGAIDYVPSSSVLLFENVTGAKKSTTKRKSTSRRRKK